MPRRRSVPPLPLPHLRPLCAAARRVGLSPGALHASSCPRYRLPSRGIVRAHVVRFADHEVEAWLAGRAAMAQEAV
jgi:hypothetical protein